MRKFNIWVGILGMAIFAASFMLINFFPQSAYLKAQGYIVHKVEQSIEARTANLGDKFSAVDDRVGGALSSLADRFSEHSDTLTEIAKSGSYGEMVAEIVAKRCELDCGESQIIKELADNSLFAQAARFKIGEQTLLDLANDRVDKTISAIKSDITVFSLSNFVVSAMIFLIALTKGELNTKIRPIAIFLLIAMAVGTYWYIFGQDWISLIIFNSFIGTGYTIFISMIFLFLCDIWFLNGFFTRIIVDAIARTLQFISNCIPG